MLLIQLTSFTQANSSLPPPKKERKNLKICFLKQFVCRDLEREVNVESKKETEGVQSVLIYQVYKYVFSTLLRTIFIRFWDIIDQVKNIRFPGLGDLNKNRADVLMFYFQTYVWPRPCFLACKLINYDYSLHCF